MNSKKYNLPSERVKTTFMTCMSDMQNTYWEKGFSTCKKNKYQVMTMLYVSYIEYVLGEG